LAGDEVGAWMAVQQLLAGGLSADAVLLDVLAPVLADIGDGWAAGTISVADEHRASQVAGRVVGRLGAAFDRPGRRRRSVVVATPSGERHGLPLAMVVDLLRWAGHRVVDLGVDLPAEVVGTTVATIPDVLTVALGVTVVHALGEAAATVDAVHRHAQGVPVLVGGAAVMDEAAAEALGADGWSGVDGRSLLRAVARLEGRSDAPIS
jgi:methanogenic corrinoid protein MtbC1